MALPTRRQLLKATALLPLGCRRTEGGRRTESPAVPPTEVPVVPPLLEPAAWAPGRHRGMNLAHIHKSGHGYGSEACRARLRGLAEHGVTHVAFTPFAYQESLTGSRIHFGDFDPTLTAAHLQAAATHCHELGLKVVLKPHIWCRGFSRGKSRQDIAPTDGPAWVAAYTRFARAQAKLAQQVDAELFVVGLEYLQITLEQRGAWAQVAAACREEFSGALTYAANWWKEVDHFADWSAFDHIGVQAYFPLEISGAPTADALAVAWAPHLAALATIAQNTGRSVIFTEAGVPAIQGAWATPWDGQTKGSPAPELPPRYVDALLRAAAAQPWFQGVYWWKWFSDDPSPHPHDRRDPFALSGTAAAQEIRRHWSKTAHK